MRAHERHLVEALLALEDRAALQAEDPLEVRRREHLALEDRVLEVGRELAELLDAGVAVALAVAGLQSSSRAARTG